MLLAAASVIAGLVLLVLGGDRFVAGAGAVARNLGVSPLVVGLTVVGLGTSAPELLVAGTASLDGNPGIAIGNVFGSNICNIGLVLGLAALLSPVRVESATLGRELPAMLAVMLLAGALILDRRLDTTDGLVLLASGAGLVWLMVRIALAARRSDRLEEEFEAEARAAASMRAPVLWTGAGLALLILGARLTVSGAVTLATALGVSDLVIGLTVVAIGTSLPELAATVAALLKGEDEIAVGNVIGSNMFNLLPVLAVPALMAPGALPGEVFGRDYVVMLAMGVALMFMCGVTGRGRVDRWEGAALLAAFAGYQWLLYQAGSTHV